MSAPASGEPKGGNMHEQDKAILKSLVSVAWADGRVTNEETDVLEAILQAFEATPEDEVEMRTYALSPRTLADIPLTDLSADDRRLLIQHAVLLTYIDGKQSPEEKTLLTQLCERLRIAPAEASTLVSAAEARAKRFLDLL
jgi:tellurite resistance protein